MGVSPMGCGLSSSAPPLPAGREHRTGLINPPFLFSAAPRPTMRRHDDDQETF
jgi:hypothetical protein